MNMRWILQSGENVETCIDEERAAICFQENARNTYVELEYQIPFSVTGDEYVLFPSCCYDGNRFDVLKKKYPPLFTPEEAKTDMPVTITDVPRLEKDGSGVIEVTTGDVSVPCVGVYSKKEKRAVLFYTIQEIEGVNLGLAYQKGSIRITYPHMRKRAMYLWPFMQQSRDEGKDFSQGETIQIPFRIKEFACDSMEEFYHMFFETRKCMGMDDRVPEPMDEKQQFRIQCGKMNRYNWKEEGKFYGTEITPAGNMSWQPGWIGGGMYTYPLMRLGGSVEWERGMSTLRHLFRQQSPSGFFYESSDEKGNPVKDIFGCEWSKDWHMVRKSADILYYLFIHFDLMKERGEQVPKEFEDGTRKLANAFVRLWKKYGQFGQFVSLTTGDIIVGGSTSGAMAAAGLAEAAKYFGDASYMETAEKSGEYYYTQVKEQGYTTGGPGEILQCPDSESAFALLESMTTLYRLTGNEKWLSYSRYLAEFCSSWVVAYNYKFRRGSEFARLDMKTTGCVFANAQNKHAAPGICTLSGYSLYDLYRWTGEEKYLELFRDITDTVSQYMSTEQRPIYSWDVPKDAMLLENGENTRIEPEKQEPGFMCERVNMSDWETERCIGGVFPGSCCWCETANLLILAEKDKRKGGRRS